YNAVRQTLRHLCKRSGAKLIEAPVVLPLRNDLDLESSIQKNFTGKTRLLVLDHIASATGLIFPVRRLARFAHARGVKVLVDGAHAPGQIALDVPSLGVDWYTGNCHKWLFAPKGCAFLWARRSAQADLHPTTISHGYGKGFAAEFDWTGTRDFSAWLAVTDALDFYRDLGPAGIRNYCHKLVVRNAKEISESWNTPLDGPAALHGSMMAIRLPDALQRASPLRLQQELLSCHRVVVPVVAIGGGLWIRISAQIYNADEDYERLLAAVKRVRG
ncbi:MAG: aminotransferase class V-fold PLP-dependent enzyme, partial [Burkholderiales bacterium]